MRSRLMCLRRAIISENRAFLHHQEDVLGLANILNGISVCGNHIS